jgi:hypothetical protein
VAGAGHQQQRVPRTTSLIYASCQLGTGYGSALSHCSPGGAGGIRCFPMQCQCNSWETRAGGLWVELTSTRRPLSHVGLLRRRVTVATSRAAVLGCGEKVPQHAWARSARRNEIADR